MVNCTGICDAVTGTVHFTYVYMTYVLARLALFVATDLVLVSCMCLRPLQMVGNDKYCQLWLLKWR